MKAVNDDNPNTLLPWWEEAGRRGIHINCQCPKE
jgi:hypothetical protein